MMAKVSSTNVYISKLPTYFNNEVLLQLVTEPGIIRSSRVAIGDDGKCLGYAFIDFINASTASTQVKNLKERFPLFSFRFAKAHDEDIQNLYIDNLPLHWTPKNNGEFETMFNKYGPVASSRIAFDRTMTHCLGYGFVKFSNASDAERAMKYINSSGVMLDGANPLTARYADYRDKTISKSQLRSLPNPRKQVKRRHTMASIAPRHSNNNSSRSQCNYSGQDVAQGSPLMYESVNSVSSNFVTVVPTATAYPCVNIPAIPSNEYTYTFDSNVFSNSHYDVTYSPPCFAPVVISQDSVYTNM